MTDALERLKKRQRPTVPPRDASLTPTQLPTPTSPDTSTLRNLNEEIPITSDIPNTPDAKPPTIQNPQPAESADTSISRILELQSPATPALSTEGNLENVPLQTKQSTLRLEQGVSDRLQALTRTEGLCREVLIEAMFEYCEAHPEAMEIVLEASRTKNEYRQQIANLKRAKSMMQRFGTTG